MYFAINLFNERVINEEFGSPERDENVWEKLIERIVETDAPELEGTDGDEKTTRKRAITHLQELCEILPLRSNEEKYQFIHRSFYEHLIAEFILLLGVDNSDLIYLKMCLNNRPIQEERKPLRIPLY